MSAARDYSSLIIEELSSSNSPLTASEITKKIGAPLPVVIRYLQSKANESIPMVERINSDDGSILYRYIGPSIAATEPASPIKRKSGEAGSKSTSSKGKKSNVSDIRESRKTKAKEAKPAPAKHTPSDEVDTGSVYKKIAEALAVPMNLTRLQQETGIATTVLEKALATMSGADLVAVRQVMDDTVYKGAPGALRKIDTLDLPALAITPTSPETKRATKSVRKTTSEDSPVASIASAQTTHSKKEAPKKDEGGQALSASFVAHLKEVYAELDRIEEATRDVRKKVSELLHSRI